MSTEVTENALRFLREAILCGALRFDETPLKSGRMSPYFFNAGLFDDGHNQQALGLAYAKLLLGLGVQFDTVVGILDKGAFIAPATAMTLANYNEGRNVEVCLIRKEAKDHGEGGSIIGRGIKEGAKVVILDDVITDGATKRYALDIVRSAGAEVVGIVVAFDRGECRYGAMCTAVQEFQDEFTIPVYSVATVRHLVALLGQQEETEKLKVLGEYLAQYGA